MPKKIAFFVPYFWAPHLETDLELIHQHIVSGDDITVFICASELPSCFSNAEHSLSVCNLCKARRRNGLNALELTERVGIKNFLNIQHEQSRLIRGLVETPSPASIASLKTIRVDAFELGIAVFNELVGHKRNANPSLDENYVKASIESGALVYYSFRNHFRESKPDLFYTFNGRFVISSAAVAAAKAEKVSYALHDRAGVLNRYWLVENESLHSLPYWKSRLANEWSQSELSQAEKERLGAIWFEDRLQHKNQGWFSVTGDQSIDLPQTFDSTKTNIVIFNHSEWEYNGFEEFALPFYKSQSEAILALAQSLKDEPRIQIYLRVHPCLKDNVSAETEFIEKQLTRQFPNFEVIPADASVKTYKLMEKASLVVSYGSTTGIEAVYQGTPSILLGHAWFEDLDACLTVPSHRMLVELILSESYKCSEKEIQRRRLNALKYGFFIQTGGSTYKVFDQTDIFDLQLRNGTTAISYDPPSYTEGLKRELPRRMEATATNPLTSAISELTEQISALEAENQRLNDEIVSSRKLSKVQCRIANFFPDLRGALARRFARKSTHDKLN